MQPEDVKNGSHESRGARRGVAVTPWLQNSMRLVRALETRERFNWVLGAQTVS